MLRAGSLFQGPAVWDLAREGGRASGIRHQASGRLWGMRQSVYSGSISCCVFMLSIIQLPLLSGGTAFGTAEREMGEREAERDKRQRGREIG